jgi:ABC-type nitrate/sulfonate/bicarbonate transport system permease component
VIALWLWTNQAEDVFFPPLQDVLQSFERNWLFERVGSDLVPSLWRMAVGWSVAVVAGVVFGVLIGLSATARRVTSPLVEFGRALPAAALLPLMVVAFGFQDIGKVVLIAVAVVPFVLLNVSDGVRGIDPLYRDTCRSFGIGRWRELRSVVLPAALPRIFAGARLGLVVALVAMVLSEFTASANGVGHFIVQSQQSFAIPDMWSGILLLGILGYAFALLMSVVERRLLFWQTGLSAPE